MAKLGFSHVFGDFHCIQEPKRSWHSMYSSARDSREPVYSVDTIRTDSWPYAHTHDRKEHKSAQVAVECLTRTIKARKC